MCPKVDDLMARPERLLWREGHGDLRPDYLRRADSIAAGSFGGGLDADPELLDTGMGEIP